MSNEDATAESAVVVGTDYNTFSGQLGGLDAVSGAELGRLTLGDPDGRGLAVAGDQVGVTPGCGPG
jgi:outer membrane protein assembly factor BamB